MLTSSCWCFPLFAEATAHSFLECALRALGGQQGTDDEMHKFPC